MRYILFCMFCTAILSAPVGYALTKEDSQLATSTQEEIKETDWPQLQHDAAHTGYAEKEVKEPFKIAWTWWKAPLSQRMQPVIAYNLVFIPSIDGYVYALNAETGKLVWKTKCGEKPYVHGIVHSAAVNNKRVFVGSLDKKVYALDAKTGKILWSSKTNGRIRSAPVVAEDKVFIGSSDGFFYAFNTENGKTVWKTEIGVPVLDTAAYRNGKVFFGAENAKAYALDAKNGQKLWEKQLTGQGIRDRWTVAAEDKVIFTTMPVYGEHSHIANGTHLIRDNCKKDWSGQRQAIEDYFKKNPYKRCFYVLDAETGKEPYIAPVLYTGGSQSPHPQAVIAKDGSAYVIYRTSEVGGFETYGPTTQYGLYLGKMDLNTGDIERLDAWGHKPPPDHNPKKPFGKNRKTKAPIISDESYSLSMAGKDLHITGSGRYRYLFRTPTKEIIGLINTESWKGSGLFSNLKMFTFKAGKTKLNHSDFWNIKHKGKSERIKKIKEQLNAQGLDYSEWPETAGDITGDGNDRQRPHAIVGNKIYYQYMSKVMAIEGTVTP